MRKVNNSQIEYLPTTNFKVGFRKFCQRLGAFMDGAGSELGDIASPDVDDIVKAYDIHWLQKLLDYQGYNEKGYFVNKESCGFVFECMPLVGITENTVDGFVSLFQGILPVGSNLQCMLVADHRVGDFLQSWRNGVSSKKELIQKLADHRVKHYKNKVLTDHNRIFKLYISYSQEGVVDVAGERQLLRLKRQILNQLKAAGLMTKSVDASGLIEFLYNILYPNGELTPQKRKYNPLMNINRQVQNPGGRMLVLDDNLEYEDDQEKWDIKTYTMTNMPEIWDQALMSNLLGSYGSMSDLNQIPCPFIIHYGVKILSNDVIKTKMAKADRIEQQTYSAVAKNIPTINQQHEEWKFAKKRVAMGDKFLEASYSVILYCPHGNDLLIDAEQKLKHIYQLNGFGLKQNKFIHLPTMLSCLPMAYGAGWYQKMASFSRMSTSLSCQPANLAPLPGGWIGNNGVGLLLEGRWGELMNVNFFDTNNNYNIAVGGKPGAGKSALMQEIMAAVLRAGGRVFVFDVGRSFEGFARDAGGTFMSFEGGSKVCINPFSTIKVNDGSINSDDYKEYIDDIFSYLKDVISAMAAPKAGLSDYEDVIVSKALLAVWEQYQQDTTITILANYLQQLDSEAANRIGEMLFPYTKEGSYGRFFEGKANVNLSDDIVVIETEELKNRLSLQRVIQQIMVVQITNTMFGGDRKTKFNIIFDEAWHALEDKQMAKFMESLARKARKYQGGLVIGTQSVSDFFKNDAAKATFEMAAWKCLMEQEEEAIRSLKNSDQFRLDDNGLENTLNSIRTLKGSYSEMYLRGGGAKVIVRLKLDPYSLLLYSSASEDFVAKQEKIKQGYSIGESVELILRERGLM